MYELANDIRFTAKTVILLYSRLRPSAKLFFVLLDKILQSLHFFGINIVYFLDGEAVTAPPREEVIFF